MQTSMGCTTKRSSSDFVHLHDITSMNAMYVNMCGLVRTFFFCLCCFFFLFTPTVTAPAAAAVEQRRYWCQVVTDE